MQAVKKIEQERDAVLEEMRNIRSMERGSITEQYMKVPHKGKKEPVMRGPYYMLTRRENDRTVGYRLKTPQDLERARRDVEAHKQFVALCREYEELTERLGELERSEDGDVVEKKRLKSRSNKIKK